MKKTFVILTLAIFMSGSFQGAIFAQNVTKENKNCPNSQFAKHGQKLGQELNLTEEQRAKAKEIREQSKDKIKPIIQELKSEKQKYKEMEASGANQKDLQKQKQKIKELAKNAQEIRKQNLASFEQILTPEQKVQFEQIKQKKRDNFKGKMKQKHNKNFEKFNQE